MEYKTFASYREASQFAREQAMQYHRSVEMIRRGNEFVVPDFGGNSPSPAATPRRQPAWSPPTRDNNDWWEQHLEEQRKKEAKEAARRLAEDQRHEANKKRLAQRKPYLVEREKYYRALGDSDLDQEWADKDSNALEPDEKQLLRDIVRERKGITPAYGSGVQVCGSCGEVGENCTCGSSWF